VNCFMEEEKKGGERWRERNEEKTILRMFVKWFDSKLCDLELSGKQSFSDSGLPY
jgi:hypothetical protein